MTTKTYPTTTTPPTTTTELSTKMSTIFNRIDIMLNKSWSVETTTITTTVSMSTTTENTEPKSTVQVTTEKPVKKAILNNIYGLSWRKQGVEYNETVSWRNMR